MDGVTEQMEEYIETIYRIQVEGGVAKTGEIAKELGVAPPSVTDMIQKLEKAAMVEYVPYRGVSLTPIGKAIGEKVLGRHRVMQAFLQEACGMDHGEAHEASCDMEHFIPQQLNDWMEDYLERKMGKRFDVGRKVKEQIAS